MVEQKKFPWDLLLFLSAILFGLAVAASVSLHLGLLQDMDLYNKLLLLALLCPPIVCLVIFLAKFLIKNLTAGLIIVPFLISAILTIGFFQNYYTVPQPVRFHSFLLEVPNQDAVDLRVRVIDIRVEDVVNQNISFDLLRHWGPVIHYKDKYMFIEEGGKVNFERLYAGTLKVLLTPDSCPSMANASIDGRAFTLDLCSTDSENGFTFFDRETGTVPAKWTFLLKTLVYLDVLLFSMLIFGLVGYLEISIVFLLTHKKEKLVFPNKSQLGFFSLITISTAFILTLILWKKINTLIIFLPYLIFILFLIWNMKFGKDDRKKIFKQIAVLVLLISGAVINLFLNQNQYFSAFNINMIHLKSDTEGSYDAMVNTIYRDLTNSIFYGYGDFVYGRTIITSQDIVDSTELDDKLLRRVKVELQIQPEMSYDLTYGDFTCLLEKHHTIWETMYITLFVLDKDYFSDTEPIILGRYQNAYVLFPNAFILDEGFCK
jgi:hypothetical protein